MRKGIVFGVIAICALFAIQGCGTEAITGGTATASTEWTDGETTEVPAKAIDGRNSTNWSPTDEDTVMTWTITWEEAQTIVALELVVNLTGPVVEGAGDGTYVSARTKDIVITDADGGTVGEILIAETDQTTADLEDLSVTTTALTLTFTKYGTAAPILTEFTALKKKKFLGLF